MIIASLSCIADEACFVLPLEYWFFGVGSTQQIFISIWVVLPSAEIAAIAVPSYFTSDDLEQNYNKLQL